MSNKIQKKAVDSRHSLAFRSHFIWGEAHACFAGHFFSFLIVFTGSAQSIEVCDRLARSGLVDTRDVNVISNISLREFIQVCEERRSRSNRYRSTSSGFKASFKGFGLGGSSSGNNALSEQEINSRCDLGEEEFGKYLTLTESQVVGSTLADKIVECVEVATREKQELITGEIRVFDDDKGFIVDGRYVGGSTNAPLKLTNIVPAMECYSDQSKAVPVQGNRIVSADSEFAFVCSKPAGVASFGTVVFSRDVGAGALETRSVRFTAFSRDLGRETAAEIQQAVVLITDQLKTDLEQLRTEVSSNRTSISNINLACKIEDTTPFTSCVDYPNIDLENKCSDGYVFAGLAHVTQGDAGCGHSSKNRQRGAPICCKVSTE